MDKRFYLLLIIVLNSLCISAEVRVETMETYEFLAALSRVAGYPEFCQENSSYAHEIDSWFEKYKDHGTVAYHKKLRTTHNIMYDAIATMGVHLTIENGALVLIPDTKIEETRWSGVNINEAVSKYNQYYQETKFHELYMAHKDEFEQVVDDYRKRVLPYFDEGWYNAFYGVEAKDNFCVVIGFCNGYNNYGVSRQIADNKRDVFNVGYYNRNEDPAGSSSTLIHEFNHSFVNPLLDESTNYNMMKDNGTRLFELAYLAMAKAQAYGIWTGMLSESFVRAGVVIYMLEHNYTYQLIENDILNNVARGFTWTPELVESLRYYESHRDEYKTLNDFYPEINKCLGTFVEQIEARIKDCTKIQDGTSITINNDEFSHSAVDPLLNISTNYNLMKDCGQWLYQLSWLDMQYQSFDNWQAVFNESIVKAGAIVSMLSNNENSKKINDAIVDGISKGFTWMPELVGMLVYYATHHDKYATLSDFFPDIAQCLNDYVGNVRNKMDSCTGIPPKENREKTIDGVLFKFETNRDNPTTLTLVGIGPLNGNTLTIPATVDGMAVKSIGEEVFYQNNKIIKVIIPEGVERIERYAFNRSSLQEIELPSTLKTIGYGAFALCNLTSFHIPASVNTLDYQCIANNMITSLTVDENNPVFDSRDNCNAVIETATNTLVHATLSTVIPKSVTAIGEEGYNCLQRMTSVRIPSWITSIGDRAFSYCKHLETIYCEIEKPFPIGEETFLWATEATLFVPYGSKELYRSTEGWKLFTNIVEMEDTGIHSVTNPEADNMMYDLRGNRIIAPRKGIIIKNGKKLINK